MHQSPHKIWEDDKYVYIPEEFFELLPPDYREAAEALSQQGSNKLRIADQDIQNLVRLINAIPTSASLSYIYHRLRFTKYEATTEWFMEMEMLNTAFVVTYSRLFTGSTGATGFSKRDIPKHLREVHEELLDIRNRRYAHNGGHETVDSSIGFTFDDTECRIEMQMSLGLYVGGRDEWKELIQYIDKLMHQRLHKILARLKDRTGYEWTLPAGPAPAWIKE